MSNPAIDPQTSAAPPADEISPERREFLKQCLTAAPLLLGIVHIGEQTAGSADGAGEAGNGHYYGMGIDVKKCIGCGRCADACKTENSVPREPFYFRTWVERYVITTEHETVVTSPNGGINGFQSAGSEKGILRSFFVPKLCNHCANPPCVQVCPVGATFATPDGVVLVDKD